jgi:hypothetical protein
LVLYGGGVRITSNGFVNVVSKFTTPRILAKRIGDNISRVKFDRAVDVLLVDVIESRPISEF